MSAAGVALREVHAGYGLLRRRVVLDGVSLEASAEGVTAIVGPNGVGKTTLFRVLLGFLAPWQGVVEVCGSAPAALRRTKGIGYLPESVALPAGYTLEALLQEGARLSRLRGAEANRRVDRVLEEAELGDVRGRPVDSFSKGMGRRAALAYATLGDPPLLLLDEPLSGLDPRSRVSLRETISAAARRSTVILTSHDLDEVRRSAANVVVMSRGRAIRRLAPGELEHEDLERIVLAAERLS